jgi:predicted secreted Zn-dependent protease
MGSLACSLVAVSSIAEADTSVRKSTVYFTVRGKTASELDNALMRGGPQVGGMARHPGAAQIKFSGDIKYNESKGRCSVGVARVNLNLKIILPNWQDRPGAGRGLAVLWDSLSGDIKRHEERHAEIATQHAHQLEQALKNLPPQKNCQDMQALVAKTTDQQIALHDADQRRFDEVEMANFEARVMRLIKERTAQLEANAAK